MAKLSITRARELIKRELGISATTLVAPPDMNQNPNYPWYELYSGNQCIEVYTNDVQQGKYTDRMVVLQVTHENSSKGATEYFYSDTLEYAGPYTEWQNREIFCEAMDNLGKDTILIRLRQEALDDCLKHFHGQPVNKEKILQPALSKHETAMEKSSQSTSSELSELRSYLTLEGAAWDNFQGKLLQGHDLFKIRIFDLYGIFYSDAGPFDETQLDWWIKEVTRGVDNNPDKAAGFSVFQWDRKNESWMDYCPDGKNQLRYDTGRRSDGTVHEKCIQQIPAIKEFNNQLSTRLAIAQQNSETGKNLKHNQEHRDHDVIY